MFETTKKARNKTLNDCDRNKSGIKKSLRNKIEPLIFMIFTTMIEL